MLWWVGPTDEPEDLTRHLEARGFARTGALSVMAADLHLTDSEVDPPPGFVLEQVSDPDTLRLFSTTMAVGSELPPHVAAAVPDCYEQACQELGPAISNFIGRLNGEAVGTSSILVSGGVAGVYSIATLQEARRQGIGTAMTVAACARARELGYRLAVLQSSEAGFGIYQKIGFREYGRMTLYLWMPKAA